MNKTYTVGQYLIDRLTQLNLEHLFSIAGDYTIEWINNYVEPSTVKVIEEVNELNAGYAADGYARLKGIGAVCFTYSAGSLCAVNAIAGAYVERVPVVVINGSPNIKQRLTFEQTGFAPHHLVKGETDFNIYDNITTAAVKIDNPDTAPMLIDFALTQCITERRPIYIELLDDMVNEICETPKETLKPARKISDKAGLEKAIKIIQERIEKAKTPVLWVGVEVDRFGLQAKVEKLIKQLNIPYVTELLSKGVLSENDPKFGGCFDGLASSKDTQDLIAKSDFVLALGVWLTDIDSLGEGINCYDKTTFVSFDTVKLIGDFIPQVVLSDFLDEILEKNISCDFDNVSLSQAEIPTINLNEEITYQGFYNFIQNDKCIDSKTIVGSDSSLNYFGNLSLKINAPRSFIAQPSYSAIGYIGPAATGLCLAKKEDQRVIVFTGDGGFQMSAQCLSTQTRFGLNPIIFIIDNGSD